MSAFKWAATICGLAALRRWATTEDAHAELLLAHVRLMREAGAAERRAEAAEARVKEVDECLAQERDARAAIDNKLVAARERVFELEFAAGRGLHKVPLTQEQHESLGREAFDAWHVSGDIAWEELTPAVHANWSQVGEQLFSRGLGSAVGLLEAAQLLARTLGCDEIPLVDRAVPSGLVIAVERVLRAAARLAPGEVDAPPPCRAASAQEREEADPGPDTKMERSMADMWAQEYMEADGAYYAGEAVDAAKERADVVGASSESLLRGVLRWLREAEEAIEGALAKGALGG